MSLRLLPLCVLLASAPTLGFELKKDSTGASIRWPGHADFVVDDRAAKALDERHAFAAIEAAVATLGRAIPAVALTLREGQTSGVGYDLAKGAANQSEIVVITEDWPFDAKALGVAVVTVNLKTHEILDADIALNGDQHEFAVLGDGDGDPREDGKRDDIQNTVTHELGHALGLAHNPADSESVMFPMAYPGETKKRTPTSDDEAGLVFLYPAPAPSAATQAPAPGTLPQVGCAAAAGPSTAWLALLLAPLALRLRAGRARALAGLVAVALPCVSLASPPPRDEAQASTAEVVATGEVMSRRTLLPGPGQKLLVTEVELAVRSCLKGGCGDRLVIRLPGGTVGDLEQMVDGAPLPAPGELVGVTVAPGRPGPARVAVAAVYRLALVRDFVAFARGLSAAGLALALPLPGSAQPPRSPHTPRPEP